MALEKIERLLKRYREESPCLVEILQDMQAEYNYLPEQPLKRVAQELGFPLSQIYSLATFYKSFSLAPLGRHRICVCLGTACHVRGGARVMNKMVEELGIQPDETREDLEFTLEKVHCLGACALAPVVVMDGKYHGRMNTRKIPELLKAEGR